MTFIKNNSNNINNDINFNNNQSSFDHISCYNKNIAVKIYNSIG